VLIIVAVKAGAPSDAGRPASPGAMINAIKPLFSRPSLFEASFLTYAALASFAITAVIQLIRWIRFIQPVYAGFFWVIISSFFALAVRPSAPALNLYTSAAGILMIGAIVETSFTMAYHDDLTGLPGRRSLNEALLNLGRKYTIAMIDVDHFKKFNDTYGHDTGDQVLKLIASKLGRMDGGARVFRYGGKNLPLCFRENRYPLPSRF